MPNGKFLVTEMRYRRANLKGPILEDFGTSSPGELAIMKNHSLKNAFGLISRKKGFCIFLGAGCGIPSLKRGSRREVYDSVGIYATFSPRELPWASAGFRGVRKCWGIADGDAEVQKMYFQKSREI